MIGCQCVARHIPKPLTLRPCRTGRGVVWLCPTAFDSVTALVRLMEARAGDVPGSETKHYGKYIRDLAESIYNERFDL